MIDEKLDRLIGEGVRWKGAGRGHEGGRGERAEEYLPVGLGPIAPLDRGCLRSCLDGLGGQEYQWLLLPGPAAAACRREGKGRCGRSLEEDTPTAERLPRPQQWPAARRLGSYLRGEEDLRERLKRGGQMQKSRGRQRCSYNATGHASVLRCVSAGVPEFGMVPVRGKTMRVAVSVDLDLCAVSCQANCALMLVYSLLE
jgi:hypothetical protein